MFFLYLEFFLEDLLMSSAKISYGKSVAGRREYFISISNSDMNKMSMWLCAKSPTLVLPIKLGADLYYIPRLMMRNFSTKFNQRHALCETVAPPKW